MAIDLFDACGPAGDGEEEDVSKIEIDEAYGRRLEHNKKREALQRYEELKKQGRVASDEDDEDDDEDDEDDDLADFLETLVRVKKNDPEILQNGATIYSSEDDDDDEEEDAAGDSKPKAAAAAENKKKKKKKKKDRPMYLKDVMAKHLIEEGPEFVEKRVSSNPKVYNKEQLEGLKEFLEAEKEAFGADDNDGDIIKEKDASGRAVVGGEGAHEVEENLDEFFGKDDDLSDNEKFLKEYLRNRMWIDKETDKKPSFDDVCGVSEDEDELDKQDDYEAKYNFRHEEGAADRVLGYSRVVDGSVRKKTSSRTVQRKSKEERMAFAEQERKEELKHLKNLKKKEIQERLDKIRAVAGIADDRVCKLGTDDLEEDFDPEEYDKKMKEVFDADYYEAEDTNPDFGSDDEAELEKPDFDKEDELLGLPEGWDVGGSGEGFAAARERFLQMKEGKEGEEKEVEGKRKRKRKISLKEKVELEKELEEYYKLDYEDTIGDLKTRFKYKSVPSNRYGLRPEELLIANDKDLNQYVSLKKLAPYRQNEWKVTYHQKLKKDLILQGGKNERKKKSNSGAQEGRRSSHLENKKQRTERTELNGEEQLSRRSRRRRRQAELRLPQSRLRAYGEIPTNPRKKH